VIHISSRRPDIDAVNDNVHSDLVPASVVLPVVRVEPEHVLLAKLLQDVDEHGTDFVRSTNLEYPAATLVYDLGQQLELLLVLDRVLPGGGHVHSPVGYTPIVAGRDTDPINQYIAFSGNLKDMRHAHHAVGIDTVREQYQHPSPLTLSDEFQGDEEMVLQCGTSARLWRL